MGLFSHRYGKCFGCVPVKLATTVLAVFLFLNGVVETSSWIIFRYRSEGHISSALTRHGVVSCVGLQTVSQNIRVLVEVLIGCLVGFVGILGLIDNCGVKLRYLYNFVLLAVATRLINYTWDMFYLQTCGAYSENVMQILVFWNTWELPIPEKRKEIMLKWEIYDYQETNTLVHANLSLVYFLQTVFVGLLLLYLAVVLYRFTEYFLSGEAGLGEFVGLVADVSKRSGKHSESDHPLLKPADFWDNYTFSKSAALFVAPEGKFSHQ